MRRATTAFATALLLAGAAACTGGGQAERPPASRPSVSQSTGSTATLHPAPVPLRSRVTRVAGRLSKPAQASVERSVGRVVGRYFQQAYLGGDYPRSRFPDAFDTFAAGVSRQARRDASLLTNRDLGPTTVSVTPRQQDAWLTVLAPNRVAAGVTARVRLEYVAERGDRTDQRVTVSGRLMLTRQPRGGWQIFGYDLARSAVPVKGATR